MFNKKHIGAILNQLIKQLQDKGSLTVNFMGCRPGQGVTTVVAGIAQYLMKYPITHKSIFIDLNNTHPDLHAKMGIPSSPGLVNVLLGEVALEDAIIKKNNGLVSFLPFGHSRGQEHHFHFEQINEVFNQLKKEYALLCIDSPAQLDTSDAIMGARIADLTYFVIASGTLPAKAALYSKREIEAHDGKPAGVILNKIRHDIPDWLYRLI